MKKVMVVDDNERFPDAGPFKSLVVFKRELTPDELDAADPGEFATAFVHVRNGAEADWAAEHYEFSFVFTGDDAVAPDVSEFEGIYELPRWAFERYFTAFMAAYAEESTVTERVANIFYGE